MTPIHSSGSKLALRLCAMLILVAAAMPARAEPTAPPYAEALRPRIETLLKETLAPGAVVIVHTPKGNWEEAFGTRTLHGKEPVGIDDHFPVGSITKTWTGTVILQLAQEGELKLTDPISRYVPQVPNGKNITIEQLLNMRSGLFNYTQDPAFLKRMEHQPHHVYRVNDLLLAAFRHSPAFAPGERYQYCNTNTLLLGLVIEKLTKHPVSLEMQRRLFGPFGLKQTYLPPHANTRLPVPYAHGYQYGPIVRKEPESQKADVALLRDATYWNRSWGWTAGGGISTARELANYVERMVGGGYLQPEWQRRRLQSCLPTDPAHPGADTLHYCWGLGRIDSYYGHSGQLPGYNTYMLHDPDSRTTIVVWTSIASGPDNGEPAVEIGKMITAELARMTP